MNTPSKYLAYSSRTLLASVALLALAACGKKGPLEGTYSSGADTEYKFAGDTVTVMVKGSAKSQMKYSVDGKKVTFTAGTYKYDGNFNDDGSVSMTMGVGMKGEPVVEKLVRK